ISMLVVYVLSDKPQQAQLIETTGICLIGVMISNHVVAVRYRHNKRQAIIASCLVAFLVLVLEDQIVSFSPKVIGHFGFGAGRKSDLFLENKKAGDISGKLGFDFSCKPPAPDKLCNVEILSRLGTEYYLRIETGDGRSAVTFTLPKSYVVSFDSP